jgi:3-deoxy-D-manno-octulosonate 8-phosphate phosphatase (KDO 8-P phosphatase)
MDVDGVLTDGRLYFDARGNETKSFHIRDGFGIVRAREHGITIAIVSGRKSIATMARSRELGIRDVYQNVSDKLSVVHSLLTKHDCSEAEVCFIGDDVPDLRAFEAVGVRVAPADAAEEVRTRASYVTKARGGEGAVREVLDAILRAKGIE